MPAGIKERRMHLSLASEWNGRSLKGRPKRKLRMTWSRIMEIATVGRSGMLCGRRTSTTWRSCNVIAVCVGK